MKFIELPVRRNHSVLPFFVNPDYVTKVVPTPVDGQEVISNECTITLLSSPTETTEFLIALSANETVRRLEGRPSVEIEEAERERREAAEKTILDLFGWPTKGLGNISEAPTSLIVAVAESQTAYEEGADSWYIQQRRREEAGSPRQSRPEWKFG